jgi:hypothetical protein
MHPYYLNKELIRERSPRVGLKVVYPKLWVAGDVTDWYHSFWLKHWADMGQVYWLESRG